ncbi:alpha/beta fold hydrolase [Methylobacterium sp. D53M]
MTDRIDLFRGTKRDCLVVMIHGYDGSGEQMAPIRTIARHHLPDADIFIPTLPYSRTRSYLCMVSAETIMRGLTEAVDDLVRQRREEGGEYSELYIVGYSFGAVLARRLVVLAFGEQKDINGAVPAPFETDLQHFRAPRSWAPRIRRLILLAGMNRGWSVSSAMDWITSVKWGVNEFIADTVFSGRPTIMAIRRGAPFLVQTRLQWLALMDATYGPRPEILTVQLLGSIDDWVSPDDNVDYSVDHTNQSAQNAYFYIEVPASGHRSILDMSPEGAACPGPAAERRKSFALALVGSYAQVAHAAVQRSQMQDNLPPEPDPTITDLVFVIHGIRDKGFWTQKIARTIKLASDASNAASPIDQHRKFASWTETYGYFAMMPFVFRTTRQRKVEWLMDRYVEARARYPRATFHYVGHSNGTYLAAQALQDYPGARFENIVFLGSVVRRDYDWISLTRSGRAGRILNYVATGDWVVSIFPNGLQPLSWFNLGSAGHDGFDQAEPSGPIYQVAYIEGGHGAGLGEAYRKDIAQFITSGQPPATTYPPFRQDQSKFYRILGWISPAIVAAIAATIIGAGAFLIQRIVLGPSTPSEATVLSASLAIYVMTLYIVATRV